MIDETLYRETFSRLQASSEAKKEVLAKMKDTKKTRLPKALRSGLIAAVLVAALAVSANAATGGELLGGIVLSLVSSDGVHEVWLGEDGQKFSIINAGGATELRDGRLFLLAAGQEEDITDELTEKGSVERTYDVDGMELKVTVTGTVEDPVVQTDSPYVTITSKGSDDGTLIQEDFDGDSVKGTYVIREDGTPLTEAEVSSSVTVTTPNSD